VQLQVNELPTSVQTALWIAAPVLAGFTNWLDNNIRQYDALALGVMREGSLLCRLLRDLCGRESYELDINRNLSMLAAYACGDEEALINWLVHARLKPLRHTDLKKLFPSYNFSPSLSDVFLDLAGARKLATSWREMGTQSPLHDMAHASCEKIRHHWKKTTASHSNKNIALMDFACAGNIQRSLQWILRERDNETHLIGLNFLTTKGVSWAKAQSCEIHGFIAEDGTPTWMAEAYGRASEVIEIFVAAPLGPLKDYTQEGESIRTAPHLIEQQIKTVLNWQDHIVKAAKIFYDVLGSQLTPDLCRCIWGRLLLAPLPAEVFALAEWPLDTGLEDTTTRPLAPLLTGRAENWIKAQTGWPVASLLRQKLQQ
jgi:hypothetical protein